ncbi:hypothetical protein [Bythopirellula goksoeyrii]|uniref:Uncharacterized protein n=1 Tax=Bythopirellula goksoeyrii TaxID=1400387 RepID=A0A5B9QGS6_9BACT|nr:hypothetical protein [Bythopirellula goksoeyrii]QEG37129.1 hypothetical protein Pr1d_44690 [Bythopirellula goksoeyrii]
MNVIQKIIGVTTLVCVAAFMHFFFCDWVSSPEALDSTVNGGGALTIVPFGSNSGILGRSVESVSLDAICGIAVPLLLVGSALYLAAGTRQGD